MKKNCALFLLTLLSLVTVSFAQQDQDVRHERQEASPAQRQKWFYEQRAYPMKHTPPGAHRRAFAQATEIRINEEAARAAAPQPGSAPVNAWTLIGPEPASEYDYGVTSGRITAVAVDPTTSGSSTVLYLGGAEGGIWKSTNNGASWTPVTDNQPTLAIGSIAIDPNNHLNIYAGTGEQNFSGDSYYGGGVLKSTNGGSTWTMMGASTFGGPSSSSSYWGGGSYIGAVAIQPGVSGTPVILVGSELSSNSTGYESGIWRSLDGGSTWTNVLSGGNYGAGTSVVWVSSTKAYAAISNVFGVSSVPTGVYVSTNSGASWTLVNGSSGHALPGAGTTAGRITLVAAPSNASVLYASVADYSTDGLYGMYTSTDGGSTWNPLATTPLGTGGTGDFCGTQCWYDMPLAVSPTNSSVLYAGGSFNYAVGNGGIYVTTNGGSSWATPNPGTNSVYMHPDFHAFAFSADGNTLYLGQDGGIWSGTPTNSLSMAWTDLNNGLAITEFYPGLSIYAGNKNIALNGTQDNGTQLYSGSLQWTVVECGDGAWTAIDPTNSNNMYTGCTPGNNNGVLRSTNGGSSWVALDSGINSNDYVGFIPPMVMDPNSSTTLYYGTDHLYKMVNSTGTSPTWSEVYASPLVSTGSYLTSIALTPGNSNNIFIAGSDGTVQYSTNAGSSWTQITSILPGRYATMVQADPKVSTTFYVTFSGFSGFGDSVGHVFKCSTASNSCTDMSGNLPNSPANDIVVDPDLASTYYVATDVGVYSTSNGGTTWSTAGTGLPNVAVVGLKLHEGSRTLRATTHGRSTWDLSVPASASPTITSPTPGSTLTDTVVTFDWTAASGATEYVLYVGTTPGAKNVAGINTGTNTSATVKGIPTTGGTLYVTLYYKIGTGSLQSNAYTYTELSSPQITSPTPGSTLSGSTVTFDWTSVSGVSEYVLYVGTTPGAKNIAGINTGTSTSATVKGIPTTGATLYVTLYYKIGTGSLMSNAYTFTEASSGSADPGSGTGK